MINRVKVHAVRARASQGAPHRPGVEPGRGTDRAREHTKHRYKKIRNDQCGTVGPGETIVVFDGSGYIESFPSEVSWARASDTVTAAASGSHREACTTYPEARGMVGNAEEQSTNDKDHA
eukprot:3742654-Pyramimonas_sp.AAC.1